MDSLIKTRHRTWPKKGPPWVAWRVSFGENYGFGFSKTEAIIALYRLERAELHLTNSHPPYAKLRLVPNQS